MSYQRYISQMCENSSGGFGEAFKKPKNTITGESPQRLRESKTKSTNQAVQII